MSCLHPHRFRYVNGWYCPDCKRHISASSSLPCACGKSGIETERHDSASSSLPCACGKSPKTIQRDEASQMVYKYPSKGKHYYRYQHWEGHKVIHSIHIPGGAVGNAIADTRASEVRTWILAGHSPATILKGIDQWRKGKGSTTRKPSP